MSKQILIGFILLLFSISGSIFSQSRAITIDGVFDDWDASLATYTDLPETINGVDLLEIQVTNDDQFLFIKIKTTAEFDLTDNYVAQDVGLFIDTDNDPTTGFNIQTGYGSELGLLFNQYLAHYNVNPYSQIVFSDMSLRIAPTVASNEFEIALKRDAIPDGLNPLFPSPTIRILIKNDDNTDKIPTVGNVFSYTFDETPVAIFTPTEINKEDANLIRVVSYNTLSDGLINPSRTARFQRIFTALNPDIIGLEECYNTTTAHVKSLFDSWIPLGTSHGWYVEKKEGNIVVSKWQITQVWQHLTRQFPVLIDLPSIYQTDLLFTVAHLKCCDNGDALRQDQADQYAAFILDAKTNGGVIDLPVNTPFIYVGDLNLVGSSSPLNTLLSGNIVNTATYGVGSPLDWDGTNLTEENAIQTDNKMAYTWRQDHTQYPPGKLDFTIFSDVVLSAEKSFVLQTEVMSSGRLQTYGLDLFETSTVSDHFPIVTDFSIDAVASVDKLITKNDIVIYPNPASDKITIITNQMGFKKIKIVDALGKVVYTDFVHHSKELKIDKLSNGIYFVMIEDENGILNWRKFVKTK